MADLFETPQESIDWAKTCLENAEREFRAYVQNGALANVTEFDRQTREQVRKIKRVKPIPQSVTGFIRTALVDTKHSFDQSLFACAHAAGCLRFSKTYPWADTPKGLNGIIDRRNRDKDAALPPFIVDEIRRQEPYATGEGYPGGNDLVREVAKMANDQAHHRLQSRTFHSNLQFEQRNLQWARLAHRDIGRSDKGGTCARPHGAGSVLRL